MRRAGLAAALALALFAASCRSTADRIAAPQRSVLRHPDREGVVTAADLHHVVVDGVSYALSPKLRSFAAGTLQTVPVLWRRGQYVQVGSKGRTVLWIEGIGAVVDAPGHPPTVYFSEVLLRAAGAMAAFSDGTVLHIGPTARLPAHLPAPVRAEIDPSRREIRAFAGTT